MYKKKYINFTKIKRNQKNVQFYLYLMMYIIISDIKSYLIYRNLKYGKFHGSHLTHAVLNLLIRIVLFYSNDANNTNGQYITPTNEISFEN